MVDTYRPPPQNLPPKPNPTLPSIVVSSAWGPTPSSPSPVRTPDVSRRGEVAGVDGRGGRVEWSELGVDSSMVLDYGWNSRGEMWFGVAC